MNAVALCGGKPQVVIRVPSGVQRGHSAEGPLSSGVSGAIGLLELELGGVLAVVVQLERESAALALPVLAGLPDVGVDVCRGVVGEPVVGRARVLDRVHLVAWV